MGVPVAPGVPDYTSSGTSKFDPDVWSGKMVEKFYAATVFGEIAQTDYEGEVVGYGSNVIIRTVPDVTVSNYVIGAGLTRQRPASPSVTLSINRAKSFSVALNRVQYRQADIDISEVFATDGAQKVKITADQDLLGNIFTQVAAANQGNTAGLQSQNLVLGAVGTPLFVSSVGVGNFSGGTSGNAMPIVNAITACGQALDEQNAPDEERWIVLPAPAITAVKRSPLSQAYLSGDTVSILRNGKTGMVDRFMMYQSNNLTLSTDGANKVWNIPFGHKSGLAWASQIAELREIDDPNDFGTLIDGLLVYGYQVVNPNVLGWLYASVLTT